jgi:hypothetical protein
MRLLRIKGNGAVATGQPQDQVKMPEDDITRDVVICRRCVRVEASVTSVPDEDVLLTSLDKIA